MPGVTAVLTVQAKPGRHQEVRKGLEELRGIIGNQGLRCRLLRPITGDNQGALSLATEYESLASFGAQSEKIGQSAEYQKIVERARDNPDSAAAAVSTQLYTEVE
jgi:hypothetical protein